MPDPHAQFLQPHDGQDPGVSQELLVAQLSPLTQHRPPPNCAPRSGLRVLGACDSAGPELFSWLRPALQGGPSSSCAPFKSEISFPLQLIPTGLQSQVLWGLIFPVLNPQTGEPDAGLRTLTHGLQAVP